MSYYEKHIFFCINEKDEGRKCCAQADAKAMCQFTKKQLKTLGLAGPGKIRVSFSGCLGRCAEGPVAVIYPEQIWYTYRSQADVENIITQDLLANKRVPHLLLNQEPVASDD